MANTPISILGLDVLYRFPNCTLSKPLLRRILSSELALCWDSGGSNRCVSFKFKLFVSLFIDKLLPLCGFVHCLVR